MRVHALAAISLLLACSSEGNGGVGQPFEPDPMNPEEDGGGVEMDGGSSGSSGGMKMPPPPRYTKDLALDIAIFQGVKIPLVTTNKRAEAAAPIVAGRPGVLRVYPKTLPGFLAQSVVAELTLKKGDAQPQRRELTKVISKSGLDDAPATVFDFELTAEDCAPDVSYSVAFLPGENSPGTEDVGQARYPADALENLGATSASQTIKMVLVRLPDTRPAQVELYRARMQQLYPVPSVDIQVHAPISIRGAVSPGGRGWDTLLDAFTQFRASEGPASDVYYYGLFVPASSFDAYCSQGCISGLSNFVQDPSQADFRASIGLGYPGQDSADTFVHEVGHAHGRDHAPCAGAGGNAPNDTDPRYPYPGGKLGVWGYDILGKAFISPNGPGGDASFTDLMGYCDKNWISDYNYRALYVRNKALHANAKVHAAPRSYHVLSMRADGGLKFRGQRMTLTQPLDQQLQITAFDPQRRTLAAAPLEEKAVLVRYDHLPGGTVLLPTSLAPGSWVRVEGSDKPIQVPAH
jgi:Peptidase M66